MEKILTTSSGRYKVLKLIQYISKAVLLLSTQKRIHLSAQTRRRLLRLVGQCSLQRRILQLGNLYKPLKSLISPTTQDSFNWHILASGLSALVEDAAEDIFTLSQLGWLPREAQHCAVFADRAWLVSLLLDLRGWSLAKQDIMKRKRMERLLDQRPKTDQSLRERELREEEWWLDLDGVRTMCDAGQAWCDVFEVEVFDGFVIGCALTSAILGLYRFVAKPG